MIGFSTTCLAFGVRFSMFNNRVIASGGAGIGPGGQGSVGAGVAGGVNTFDARNGGGLNAVNSITGTSQTYSQNGISYYSSPSTYGSGGTGTGGSTSGAGIQGIVVIRHRNL